MSEDHLSPLSLEKRIVELEASIKMLGDLSSLETQIVNLEAKINRLAELVGTFLVQADKIGINLPKDANGKRQEPLATLEVHGSVRINSPPKAEDGDDVEQSPLAALDVQGPVNITGESTLTGALKVNGNTTVTGEEKGVLRIKTPTGWTDVGSKHDSATHFYTDRNLFYFDREIRVNTGKIGGQNEDEDLELCIKSQPKVTIKNNGDMTVTGALHVGKDIAEGGKKLKKKYQLAGKYLESGKDGAVKNFTVDGELKVGGTEPVVLQLGQIRLEVEYWKSHGLFQGNFPATAAEWPSTARKLLKISFTAFNRTTNKWEKIPVKFDNPDWPQ